MAFPRFTSAGATPESPAVLFSQRGRMWYVWDGEDAGPRLDARGDTAFFLTAEGALEWLAGGAPVDQMYVGRNAAFPIDNG